ncbi:sulfotransferase domain-containing protein [Lutibacter sp.]
MRKVKSIIKSLLFPVDNSNKNTIKLFPDDTFIVSYPKSGNTWVRFILANLIYGDKEDITFHTAKKFIPDYEAHKDELVDLKRPRIIKSHSLYKQEFNKIIYIIRDVRDVYISYYHYLKKRLPKEKTISEFIIDIDNKDDRWANHYNSWATNKTENILIIKYEDLLDNTFYEINKILDFMKLRYEDIEIKDAIAKSSFNNMKQIEEKHGRPFLTKEAEKNSTPFVRSGKKGNWRNVLNDDDVKYLVNKNKRELITLGYKL